jgi:hypothetical protein
LKKFTQVQPHAFIEESGNIPRPRRTADVGCTVQDFDLLHNQFGIRPQEAKFRRGRDDDVQPTEDCLGAVNREEIL